MQKYDKNVENGVKNIQPVNQSLALDAQAFSALIFGYVIRPLQQWCV